MFGAQNTHTIWYRGCPYQITYTIQNHGQDEFIADDITVVMIADSDTMQTLDGDELYQSIARLAQEEIALGQTELHQEQQSWLLALANR